ncbi:MAG: hypothetical protein NC388_03075 [Clostridium sp.]|nr:hypothetical protein [Clostridium sp.]
MCQLWITVMVACMCCTSCYNSTNRINDQWDLTEEGFDSLDFATTHHYSQNFNFLVGEDSVLLLSGDPSVDWLADTTDCAVVYAGDRLVVADIWVIPSDTVDSVWVKVARDQQTMGWMHENALLDAVMPDDPISQFIYTFSDVHLIYFLLFLGVFLMLYFIYRIRRKRFRMVHFDDIGSCYPTLLCLTLSASAVLYSSIQMFMPHVWMEFYFHPTLNPFELSSVMAWFITSVWLIVLLALATVDDVLRQLAPTASLLYFLSLLGVCILCYLFFSAATLYYVGYPCLLIYAVWALHKYYRNGRCRFRCGYCGVKLRGKGRCPRCGAINE